MSFVTLGSKSVGSTVKITTTLLMGTANTTSPMDYLVIQQGKPSANYDDSFNNGTVLMIKNPSDSLSEWGNNWDGNDYAANQAGFHYTSGNNVLLFAQPIRDQVRQVRIPYRAGRGFTYTINWGASGLLAKVFLLSAAEVGLTAGVVDGALMSYFEAGTGASALAKRVLPNAPNQGWWLRTPSTTAQSSPGPSGYTDGYGNLVTSTGNISSTTLLYEKRGLMRFAIVLPNNLLVGDDGTIVVNTPPTIPPSITIPTSIQGGTTITISWGASTDAEDNLAGYIVQRSTDGGSTWTQIFQGPATSTTNNVAFGTVSVMFRVLAYDDLGLQSGWRTSSNVTVTNNRPPTAPSSITVPTAVAGGSTLTITWGTATDPDSNLAGYILERSVNGGAWTQIYQGPNLSFTDTITFGWNTVAYRVRAYDTYDAQSDNVTSPTRTVDNNRPPTITSSTTGDLGLKDTGFTWTYTVADADNDAVTVVERINNVTKRTFTATLGQANTFDVTGLTFMTILNGPVTMQVIATDPGGKSATHTVTFTKGVYSLSITLATPLTGQTSEAIITRMVMNIIRSIPSGALFKVEVTNNAKDPAPHWEDITHYVENGMNYLFSNTTVIGGNAFNFKVTASRGTAVVGGFISTIGGAFE